MPTAAASSRFDVPAAPCRTAAAAAAAAAAGQRRRRGAGGRSPRTEDGELAMEPYIESARCTTCNECTNLNRKMFAYNEQEAGVHQGPAGRHVQASSSWRPRSARSGSSTPGTPLNPKEKDLDKWIKRAEPFN